jgi:hypothetical protein
MIKINMRIKVVPLLTLALFLLLGAATGFAQHEGHTMPAKPAPKAKPKPSPAPKRNTTQKAAQPDPKQEAHEAPAKEAAEPTPAPSPSPETVPGRQEETESRPAPTPMSETKPVDHTGHTPAAATPARPDERTTAQPDAGGMSHTTMTDAGSLMVMDGDRMAIRVGSSAVNTIPMAKMGSGTSWQPASTQMNMLHKTYGDWLVMFHYNVVAGLNAQGGPRGATKVESQNWFMPMALRRVGNGTLELRGMFSFEPFTFPPGGSPLLFQTGETYKGQPIIDRQHPHDLFMELSASYTMPLGDRGTWFTYFGYPGEPALGPTAFMHRASASENPSAPLSHHLQDSSHISFGVFTTGFTYRWFKLEGSVFNGREPGENRYNFEANPWTSRSARLSFAPNDNWSLQVSHGFLRNPEALEPGDVRRTTASISYNRPFDRGNWATSLIWGRNHESHSGEIFNLNGYEAESTVNFHDQNYLYTRLELTDKNQLLRAEDRLRLGITDHHPSFRIGAYTFGGARDVWTTETLSMALGGDVTFYSKPATLDPIYGDHPKSYRFFLRFRPGKMSMSGHDMSGGMKH